MPDVVDINDVCDRISIGLYRGQRVVDINSNNYTAVMSSILTKNAVVTIKDFVYFGVNHTSNLQFRVKIELGDSISIWDEAGPISNSIHVVEYCSELSVLILDDKVRDYIEANGWWIMSIGICYP